MWWTQDGFDLRFGWGRQGLATLAPVSDVVVLIDVLSFCTGVSVALERGAAVFPCSWRDERAAAYAQARQAILARPERCLTGGFSLSPTSLQALPHGSRIVLPSPNGSELSFRARDLKPTLAGCLRNRTAVARAAQGIGRVVAVIACGERWPDDTLRPAFEDLVGAGAVLAALNDTRKGTRSPETMAAIAAYEAASGELPSRLATCAGGRELAEGGFAVDVEVAAELDATELAPLLQGEAYRPAP